jgi:flagellar motor switch protein FliM
MTMENSDESQLTQEEIDAIAEEFSDKEASVINPSSSAARVKSHDLTSSDSSLGFSNNSIDLLNERFARQLRMGLNDVLRTHPRVTTEPVQLLPFSETMVGMKPPLSIHTFRMDPLRGMSILVVDPNVVFTSLDDFFGGIGEPIGDLTPTRIFTPTEDSIIELLLNIVFGSLKEAWAPVMPVNFHKSASEINPQFVQIADEDDLMLKSTIKFMLKDGTDAALYLIQPVSLFKPVRDLLRTRVQGSEDTGSDDRWREQLKDAVLDVSVEMRITMGSASVRYKDIKNLELDQIILFDMEDECTIYVDKSPFFYGALGKKDNQSAVKITRPYTVDE